MIRSKNFVFVDFVFQRFCVGANILLEENYYFLCRLNYFEENNFVWRKLLFVLKIFVVKKTICFDHHLRIMSII